MPSSNETTKEVRPEKSSKFKFETLFGPWEKTFQWWLLIAGAIFLLLGYLIPFCEEDNIITDIIRNFGEILIIGVLVGFLSTHKTIIKNYKHELFDLLYEDEHLQKRGDISFIWDRVTNAMVKSKYPKNIHEQVLKKVKNTYLPDKDYCYENYVETITLTWHDSNKRIVNVESEAKFDIISMTNVPIELKYTNRLCVEEQQFDYRISATFSVNGQNIEFTENQSLDAEGNHLQEYKHTLTGNEKYSIIRTLNKRYDIKNDGGFLAGTVRVVTHGMSVYFFHPNDLKVQFIEFGTTDSFEKLFKCSDSCGYQLKDIVMPRQGYCFIMGQKQEQ